jgi:hypothetical protein
VQKSERERMPTEYRSSAALLGFPGGGEGQIVSDMQVRESSEMSRAELPNRCAYQIQRVLNFQSARTVILPGSLL